MKRVLIAISLATTLMLAGCFETMPKTQQVAIPEECKQEIPAPGLELYKPPYESLHMATAHLLGDREQLKGENEKLRARLKACK